MGHTFISYSEFPEFCTALASRAQLHGPVESGGRVRFAPIGEPGELVMEYELSRLPAKQYLLPPMESLLTFTPDSGYRLSDVDETPRVILGIHLCDLAAIAYLDDIFLHPEPDPQYSRRRQRLILGGISCRPTEHCSCTSFGPKPVADFFMESTAGGYRLTATSPSGARLLAAAGYPSPLAELPKAPTPPAPLPPPLADPAAYDSSPRWEEYARRCVGCGACSACCPTCFCFAVHELPDLGGTGAERQRSWDNCLFRRHGEVAGKVNHRAERLQRLRYRFLHKYYGLGPHRGSFSCVGCGRCLDACPVDIDLSVILREQSP